MAKLTDSSIPNALKKFQRDEYDRCLNDRNAFHAIMLHGAAFTAKLTEFEAAVLIYRAATLDAIQRVSIELDSDATRPTPSRRRRATRRRSR